MRQRQRQGKTSTKKFGGKTRQPELDLPSGPGCQLRMAREAIGLTQQDIAGQLRLTVENIARIERDDYSSGLASIFLRGYLRAYAKQVGIAPEEIIAAFDKLALPDARPSPEWVNSISSRSNFKSSYRQWTVYGGALALAVLLTCWWQQNLVHVETQQAQSLQLAVKDDVKVEEITGEDLAGLGIPPSVAHGHQLVSTPGNLGT